MECVQSSVRQRTVHHVNASAPEYTLEHTPPVPLLALCPSLDRVSLPYLPICLSSRLSARWIFPMASRTRGPVKGGGWNQDRRGR